MSRLSTLSNQIIREQKSRGELGRDWIESHDIALLSDWNVRFFLHDHGVNTSRKQRRASQGAKSKLQSGRTIFL